MLSIVEFLDFYFCLQITWRHSLIWNQNFSSCHLPTGHWCSQQVQFCCLTKRPLTWRTSALPQLPPLAFKLLLKESRSSKKLWNFKLSITYCTFSHSLQTLQFSVYIGAFFIHKQCSTTEMEMIVSDRDYTCTQFTYFLASHAFWILSAQIVCQKESFGRPLLESASFKLLRNLWT